MLRPSSFLLLTFLKLVFVPRLRQPKYFNATSLRGFALHLFNWGEKNVYKNVIFTSKNDIGISLRTDIECDDFQGVLSRANAQHSCKLMRQASRDKSRRKPFAWREELPLKECSAKGIEFEVLIFLRTFWIKPKSGRYNEMWMNTVRRKLPKFGSWCMLCRPNTSTTTFSEVNHHSFTRSLLTYFSARLLIQRC